MPLIVFALTTFASMAIGSWLPTAQPLLPVVALGVASLLLLAALRAVPGRRRVLAIATLLGALAGVSLVPETAAGLTGPHAFDALVERTDERGSTLVDGLGRRVRVSARMEPGARMHLEGDLRPRATFRNPSPHVAWPELRPPTSYMGDLRAAEVLSPPSIYRRTVTAVRDRLDEGLRRTLRAESYGVARALVLGDDLGLDEETTAHIRGAGLTHVLAVSGMHVTLVVGAIVWALRRLLLRSAPLASRIDIGRLVSALGVPIALVYADLSGSTPSAWRAAITTAIAWTLVAAGRRPSALGTSAGAAVVLALYDPGAALSPGFILSIAATAAIIAPREREGQSAVSQAVEVAWRAFIATLPFTLYVFGGLPWLSVVANLVVVPIASALLLPATIVHGCLSALSVEAGHLSAPIVELLSSSFVGASEAFATLAPTVTLPPPTLPQGVAMAFMALALLASRSGRERLLALSLLALSIAGLELHLRHTEQPEGLFRVTFLDVGQGDATLIDLPDGSLMAIDAGGAPNGGPDPGERSVLPLLRARRRERIDWMVITHPHPDHYGGLEATASGVSMGEVWDSGQAHDENAGGELAQLLDRLVAGGARLRRPAALCGPPRRLGGAFVEVLSPCPRFDPGYEPNDNSLVLRIRYGRRVFLFAGDAEGHAEATLRGHVGRVDVLKVGHHGSRTSSGPAFLAELRPRFAVISTGLGNRFGHPHAEVTSRLEGATEAVFRTDLDGGVVVTTDGTRLWADTYFGRHVRAGLGDLEGREVTP